MIRFILVCIVVIAYLVLTIPVLLVEWIIGKFSPMTKDISSLRMVQAIFKFILWITGAKVTVIGEENVPKDQAVLYVANHRSYFDILLTYSRCPIRTGYVAKKEMERYPLLSNWMRNLYCLFLDREDIKQGLKTILQAANYVKSGISVCIFPEGTRNKNADETDMLPFHDGSFKIATRAKSPTGILSVTWVRILRALLKKCLSKTKSWCEQCFTPAFLIYTDSFLFFRNVCSPPQLSGRYPCILFLCLQTRI